MDEQVIPVLRVADATRAVDWYGRLGFAKEWDHQFEAGFPWFVSVARGNVRLYLSEHEGDARPDTLLHLYVNDIDAVSREFGIPVDEDGLAGRECHLVDPDGTDFASPRGGPERERPAVASRQSSSCVVGAPNTAITPSPISFAITPPWRSISRRSTCT